ncbi:unnamed protein product [Caenorhabditis brenneri]
MSTIAQSAVVVTTPKTTPLKKLMADHEDLIKEKSDKKSVARVIMAPTVVVEDPSVVTDDVTDEDELAIDREMDALFMMMDKLDEMIAAAKKRCEEWDEERKAEAAEYEFDVYTDSENDDDTDSDYSEAKDSAFSDSDDEHTGHETDEE